MSGYICLTAVPFVGCVYTVVFAVADEAAVHTPPVTAPELPSQANRRIYRTIQYVHRFTEPLFLISMNYSFL
jgi:hypothetical protein